MNTPECDLCQRKKPSPFYNWIVPQAAKITTENKGTSTDHWCSPTKTKNSHFTRAIRTFSSLSPESSLPPPPPPLPPVSPSSSLSLKIYFYPVIISHVTFWVCHFAVPYRKPGELLSIMLCTWRLRRKGYLIQASVI